MTRTSIALCRVAIAVAIVSAPDRARGAQAIPTPDKQAVDIIVSGRTSTLKRIDVAAVGQQIPATFSSDRVRNTKGFAWYVSRHYALKTDYDPAQARSWLELLEMAYPHYVALFGSPPAGIESKRMTVVYAKGRDSLAAALASDRVYWDFSGGGITNEGRKAAYQFPSGSLQYHRRYILLHECAHLFQMCLAGTVYNMPAWYYEGAADALSTHVYDSAHRRLTVNVLDRAPAVNMYDRGLAAMRKTPITVAQIDAEDAAPRGVNLLLVHFLNSTPDRMHRFRLWRDEMFRQGRDASGSSAGRKRRAKLLFDLYGGRAKVEADFKAWWTARACTFHYVRWGWEQDASTLWSHGFAADGRLSQTNVNLPPGQKPVYDPFRMDYPFEPICPLVGPVGRGLAAPVVGAMVDFSPNPGKGRAGIGLGVIPGSPVEPFGTGALFVDRNANVPGVGVVVYKLASIRNGGKTPDDVTPGRQLGSAVDAEIALGLPRSPTARLEADFIVEWKGYLRIDVDGSYNFATFSDDGAWLWIDEKLVVDNGQQHAPTLRTARVSLKKGLHRLRVRYYQTRGGRLLQAGYARTVRPGCLKVLIDSGRDLVIDGTDLYMPPRTLPMPAAVRLAAHGGGHRYGLTVKIAARAVEVTVRARARGAATSARFGASVPINAVQRKRLLGNVGSVLARGGNHRVTPYFDDARRPGADLAVAANPDRWRNPADRHLAAAYRAWYRLGGQTPPSLDALRKHMLAAADGSPAAQQGALAHYLKAIAKVRTDISRCQADKTVKDRVLSDLP